MSDKQDKRKRKKKYYQNNKKQNTGVLDAGLKGILITCNNEQKCVKESYNILNEFADDLFGLENSVTFNKKLFRNIKHLKYTVKSCLYGYRLTGILKCLEKF